MAKYKVVITDTDFPGFPADIEKEILSEVGGEVKRYEILDENDLLKITRDADAIICSYAPITRNLLSNMEKVKVIVVYGVGYDNIDVEAATELGIPVCNTPDYLTCEVSEHVVALILALARKIIILDRYSRARQWERHDSWLEFTPMSTIAGKTMGIIGLGRNGRQVAERIEPFKLNILAYDPYVRTEVAERFNVKLVDLPTLLKSSDIISINASLTEETYHLIGEKELGMMKDSAILINTARGKIVDQKALIQALKSKRIAGAGLDVLEKEPPDPDDPILDLDNVIITPHIAWYSETSRLNVRRMPAEEVARVISGETPKHPVNPSVLKRR